jgi:hypothetical protein
MPTLILRELRDHIVFVGACWLLAAIAVGLAVYTFAYEVGEGGMMLVSLVLAFVLFLFSNLGAAQMYGDRANRISTLLATQATTRTRILAARALTGVLTVLVALVPLLVTLLLLIRWKLPPLEIYPRTVGVVFAGLIPAGIACHSLGLWIGLTGVRLRPIAGAIVLVTLLLSILAIQGCGVWTGGLLLLFAAAAVGRVWHTFTSTAL